VETNQRKGTSEIGSQEKSGEAKRREPHQWFKNNNVTVTMMVRDGDLDCRQISNLKWFFFFFLH